MTSVVIDADALAKVLGAWDGYAESELGPEIRDDAHEYCPKETGDLADSVEFHMDGHTIVVSATGGDDGREYAAYVELGHMIAHGPHMRIVGPKRKGAEPFLRPALFQAR